MSACTARTRGRSAWRSRRRVTASMEACGPVKPPPQSLQPPRAPPRQQPPQQDLHGSVTRHISHAVLGDAAAAPADEVLRSLRVLLESFDVVRRGMGCAGVDNGTRPIHLVIVGMSFARVAQQALETCGGSPNVPALAERLLTLAVGAARAHLVEFRGARRLWHELCAAGALSPASASEWRSVIEPPPRPSVGMVGVRRSAEAARSSACADGFVAHCGHVRARQHQLRALIASLIAEGVAVCTGGGSGGSGGSDGSGGGSLLEPSLLVAAEAEAAAMHAAGMMHSSTVKDAGASGGAISRYTDASARGDVVRWIDGSDGRYPACSALAQWLRGELMDEVRDALAVVPAGTLAASGEAPGLQLEPHTALPLSMLACYPGGGSRFKLHVDNSPEAADTRAVTAVLYLNSRWEAAHGGTLRAYGDLGQRSTPLTVEPRLGTLALFWSHRVPHEVSPAHTTRFALSLWMCVAPQQPAGWLQRREGMRTTAEHA